MLKYIPVLYLLLGIVLIVRALMPAFDGSGQINYFRLAAGVVLVLLAVWRWTQRNRLHNRP